MSRPREYDDALRTRLIETTGRLLAEEGPYALSTRRVAAEADTSTTAIYSLIGSKDELMRAVFREAFTRLDHHLRAAPTSDDPLEDIITQGHAYHDMAIESPHLYQIMFFCPVPEFVPTPDDLAFSLSTLQILIDLVQRCIDEHALVGTAEILAHEFWAANHGITSIALAGMLTPEQARASLDHVMRGMVAGYRALDGLG